MTVTSACQLYCVLPKRLTLQSYPPKLCRRDCGSISRLQRWLVELQGMVKTSAASPSRWWRK